MRKYELRTLDAKWAPWTHVVHTMVNGVCVGWSNFLSLERAEKWLAARDHENAPARRRVA